MEDFEKGERIERVKNTVAREIEKELEKGVVKELLLQAISDASEEGKSEDPLAYLGIQEAIYESRHSEHYKKYHEFDKPFSELMDMPKIQGSLGRLEEAGISVASFFENKIKAGVQKETGPTAEQYINDNKESLKQAMRDGYLKKLDSKFGDESNKEEVIKEIESDIEVNKKYFEHRFSQNPDDIVRVGQNLKDSMWFGEVLGSLKEDISTVSPMQFSKGNTEEGSLSSNDTYIPTLNRDENDDRLPGDLKASPMIAARALVRIPFLLSAYVIGRTFLKGALATASAVENLSHDNQVIQNATRPENKPTTSAQPILSDEGIGNAVNSRAREYSLLSVRKSNLSDSAIKSVQFTDSQKLAPTIIKSRSNEANSSSRSGIVAFKDEVIDPTWMEESIYPTPRTIPGYDIAFASDIAKALCDRNDVYDHASYIPAPKGFHKDEEELRFSVSEGCNDADSSSEESSLPASRKYHHNVLNLTL